MKTLIFLSAPIYLKLEEISLRFMGSTEAPEVLISSCYPGLMLRLLQLIRGSEKQVIFKILLQRLPMGLTKDFLPVRLPSRFPVEDSLILYPSNYRSLHLTPTFAIPLMEMSRPRLLPATRAILLQLHHLRLSAPGPTVMDSLRAQLARKGISSSPRQNFV